MVGRMAPLFLVLVLATASQAAPPSAPPADWTGVAPGVELRTFPLADKPAAGDGLLTVVRIDPGTARLDLALASEEPGGPRTAGAWADARKFVAVINAGMYQTDHRTNVGYLRHGKQVHQKSWRPSYQSALVFGPSEPGLPAAAILDLAGSYETGFREDDTNVGQWPIPNVLGVR